MAGGAKITRRSQLGDAVADCFTMPGYRQLDTDQAILDYMQYMTSPTMFYTVLGTFGVLGNVSDFVSGNVAGNQAGITTAPGRANMGLSTGFRWETTVQAFDGSNDHVFLGVANEIPTAASPPVEPTEAAYFRRVDVGAMASMFAVCRRGAFETSVDTGFVDTGDPHSYEIIGEPGRVIFKIDGALVAIITTNTPIAFMGPLVMVSTDDANPKEIRIAMLRYATRTA